MIAIEGLLDEYFARVLDCRFESELVVEFGRWDWTWYISGGSPPFGDTTKCLQMICQDIIVVNQTLAGLGDALLSRKHRDLHSCSLLATHYDERA